MISLHGGLSSHGYSRMNLKVMPKGDTALLLWIHRENILLLKTQKIKGELSACFPMLIFFFLVHTFTDSVILWGSQPHRGFRLHSLYYTSPINSLLSSYNVPHWTLKLNTNLKTNPDSPQPPARSSARSAPLLILWFSFIPWFLHPGVSLYTEIKHPFKRMLLLLWC